MVHVGVVHVGVVYMGVVHVGVVYVGVVYVGVAMMDKWCRCGQRPRDWLNVKRITRGHSGSGRGVCGCGYG